MGFSHRLALILSTSCTYSILCGYPNRHNRKSQWNTHGDFCSLRHRVFLVIVFQFNEKGAKARETQRVLSISVRTSFALLYIQLTITKITGFPDSVIQI